MTQAKSTHGYREQGDRGLFGPESVSWQVHREAAVMLGGARALLMHAAHPLVVAGARQTGMYTSDPWMRLERTLRLNYLVTFGSTVQANATARHINIVHEEINGVDEVTGLAYDALDPELLLWVHACLVDTALVMEHLVVGRLDDPGRERFHQESMVGAEMLRLPRSSIPQTVSGLRSYIADVISSGMLRRTDGSEAVGRLIMDPPPETPQRPLWRLISFWSFGLLPQGLRSEIYGYSWNPVQEAGLRASLAALRRLRLVAPPRLRFLPLAVTAQRRIEGRGPAVEQESESLLPEGFRMPDDA